MPFFSARKDVKAGDEVFVDGGMARFEVIEKLGPDMKCRCTDTGLLLPWGNLTIARGDKRYASYSFIRVLARGAARPALYGGWAAAAAVSRGSTFQRHGSTPSSPDPQGVVISQPCSGSVCRLLPLTGMGMAGPALHGVLIRWSWLTCSSKFYSQCVLNQTFFCVRVCINSRWK